jgi:WD40 repeat protein/DNA-binding SARP family transcriptional activator
MPDWMTGLWTRSAAAGISIAPHRYLFGIAAVDGDLGRGEREGMEITVLGPLTVDGVGILGRRDRVVLAVLASRPGLQVPPDTLADAVWGDAPPASATKNLQGCVVRLRRLLGREGIATSAFGYSLRLAPEDVDAWRFQRLVHRARELLALGEPNRASYQLDHALSLWRGEPFVDLEAWPPAVPVVRRLEELRQEAEELNAEAGLAAGRFTEVLATCQTLVREAPLREQRWALLARAQYQAGQQAEALRTIHHLKGVLARQLGIDPSPDLMALEQAILQQDPNLAVPETAAGEPVDTCPWPGLQAYDVEDADWFFGRESEAADCLDVLRTRSLLAVAGPSGSGKSSLLRAGVGAALRARGQRLFVITPGPRPMDALSALSGTTHDTVLVVDQAEEVFTLCHDEGEQRMFLDSLVDEAERRTVLVSIRADRLSDVSGHTEMSRLVERGLYLVGRLREEGLREAIERPARQAGLLVEPGLVDLLVAEVARDPGALPLLSHALQETWRRREGRILTVAGYRDSGGINGAVAQSAERLYGALEPAERDNLRELMLRLVMPDREGDPVPAKVPRRTLATDSELEDLAERLVAARLVTSDDEMLSVSHEALARAWPRLRGWLDDDVDGQRILHHLAATADGWDALGRPETELYRGVRLARALGWQDQRHASLNPVEIDFLAASREAEEVAERSAAEQAKRQAVLIRRLRLVLAGAVVLLVLALVAGGFAAVQSDRAARNAAEARQSALSADARRVGTRAQLTDDISLSLLLAAAGARVDDSPETRANLLAALAKRPTLVRSAMSAGGFLDLLNVSPDGRWIAASDDQNRMHLYDAATNRLLRSYDAGRAGEDQAVMVGAFSPDSSQLAVILQFQDSTEPVRLLDPDTMQPTAELASPDDEPVLGVDLQFSAGGRYLAATLLTSPMVKDDPSLTPGYAAVWDLRSPATPPVRVPTGLALQGLALSADGQTLYTGRPLTAYDVASGDTIWRDPELFSGLLDVNAEGTLLGLADDETFKNALLVDPATGETVNTLRGHRDRVFEIRFSPDGSLVGSVANGEVIVWDTETGRPLERWETSDPWGVGFGPDNDLVYGGGGGNSMLRTWDLSVQDTYLQQTTKAEGSAVFAHADISPDGQQVAYRWLDDKDRGWVRFIDTRTGEATPATRLPVNEGPWPLGTWHPEGGHYAAFCEAVECEEGSVKVLDSATGQLLRKSRDLVDGAGGIWSLAYVDEGRSLLAGDSDHETRIVDAENLRPRGEPFDVVADCCATPIGDGSTALVYEHGGDLKSAHWRVVDVGTGETLSEGDVDFGAFASIASPGGSTVAVAGSTGEIVIIEVSTGEEQRRSAGLGATVLWLKYSDDGERLVSGAGDGGVSLWDAASLELLGTVYPPHHGKPVPAAAEFIGDSHDVAIASYDGRVYRWETDLDRALDFACQMAGRNLTEEEWAEFLPAQPYREVCPGP